MPQVSLTNESLTFSLVYRLSYTFVRRPELCLSLTPIAGLSLDLDARFFSTHKNKICVSSTNINTFLSHYH